MLIILIFCSPQQSRRRQEIYSTHLHFINPPQSRALTYILFISLSDARPRLFENEMENVLFPEWSMSIRDFGFAVIFWLYLLWVQSLPSLDPPRSCTDQPFPRILIVKYNRTASIFESHLELSKRFSIFHDYELVLKCIGYLVRLSTTQTNYSGVVYSMNQWKIKK